LNWVNTGADMSALARQFTLLPVTVPQPIVLLPPDAVLGELEVGAFVSGG